MSFISDIMKKHPVKCCSLVLCIVLLSVFELWSRFIPLPAHEWNFANLKEIKVADPNNFFFAVFGENRNSKFVFENLLKLIDYDADIAFAIALGDIVFDGEKERYRYFFNQVKSHLAIPLITTMGSHELRGKGRGLYRSILGPFYYSFKIGRNYFVVLDDANRKGLDPEQRMWLEKELKKSLKYDTRMVFLHIPLCDPRGGSHSHCLPINSADNLINLFLKYHVTHIFASHIHGYFKGRCKEIPYTITGGAGASLAGIDPDHFFFHFLKVHIKKAGVDVKVKHVLSPSYEHTSRFKYAAWLYIFAFLRFYGIQTVLLLIGGGLVLVIYRSESRNKAINTCRL